MELFFSIYDSDPEAKIRCCIGSSVPFVKIAFSSVFKMGCTFNNSVCSFQFTKTLLHVKCTAFHKDFSIIMAIIILFNGLLHLYVA